MSTTGRPDGQFQSAQHEAVSASAPDRFGLVGAIEVSRLTGIAAIRDFVPCWEALLERDPAATVFQSSALFFAWHATAPGEEQPLMLVARVGDEVIGCAALVLRAAVTRGVRTRSVGFANPRGDLVAVCRADDVAVAICQWLQRHAHEWDVLELDDIRPATAQTVERCFGRWRRFRVGDAASAPAEAYLETSGGWEGYLKSRGGHFRHRLRPQTRRIERLGAVTVRRYEGVAASAPYEDFLRLEPESWKARSGDTRLPERERDAFRRLIRDADGRVEPDVLFLDVDARPVAAMLSLAYRHVYYLFVTYFDETIRAHYPGRRLFLESILHAFRQPRLHEISFVGAYPFARAWCDRTREYVSLKVYAPGWRAWWARSRAPRVADARAASSAAEVEHA